MMDLQHGDYVFECDGCSEVLETGTGNFESAQNFRKRANWLARKRGEEWKHYCLGCSRGK